MRPSAEDVEVCRFIDAAAPTPSTSELGWKQPAGFFADTSAGYDSFASLLLLLLLLLLPVLRLVESDEGDTSAASLPSSSCRIARSTSPSHVDRASSAWATEKPIDNKTCLCVCVCVCV